MTGCPMELTVPPSSIDTAQTYSVLSFTPEENTTTVESLVLPVSISPSALAQVTRYTLKDKVHIPSVVSKNDNSTYNFN